MYLQLHDKRSTGLLGGVILAAVVVLASAIGITKAFQASTAGTVIEHADTVNVTNEAEEIAAIAGLADQLFGSTATTSPDFPTSLSSLILSTSTGQLSDPCIRTDHGVPGRRIVEYCTHVEDFINASNTSLLLMAEENKAGSIIYIDRRNTGILVEGQNTTTVTIYGATSTRPYNEGLDFPASSISKDFTLNTNTPTGTFALFGDAPARNVESPWLPNTAGFGNSRYLDIGASLVKVLPGEFYVFHATTTCNTSINGCNDSADGVELNSGVTSTNRLFDGKFIIRYYKTVK